jgi:4'-phosphopantetheinyl transferase
MNPVHVWLAPEALVEAPGVAAALEQVLPDAEIARLADFRAESPRRLHLLARGLQRSMLSQLLPGTAPRDWRFERSASGRPSLSDAHRLDVDFNIAHTRGLVAMALGRGVRIGIDVERFERRRSLEIARRYFSAREIAALEALPADAQPRRFVALWTLKEAYLKAIGTGIAGGLGSMTFEWCGDALTFERASDADAARWRFHQWPWGEDHLLALAWLAPVEIDVECRELTATDLAAAASGQEQRPEA